jgi:predicted Zn-dependent protease with MMP-like domain
MIAMDTDAFEELVGDAIDSIPPGLRSAMENVAVVVDDESPPGNLYGLYVGVPLTERGNHYSAAVPDRITIYMATILASSRTREEVVERVRTTVVHEIAHHFGIGDRRLEELGWA